MPLRRLSDLLYAAQGAGVVGVYVALLWLPTDVDIGLYLLIALTAWVAVVDAGPPRSPRGLGPHPWVAVFLLTMALAVASSADWQRSLLLSAGFIPAMLCYLLLTRFTVDANRLLLAFLGLAALSLATALAVILAFMRYGIGDDMLATQTLIDRAGLSLLVVPNDALLLALNMPLLLALVLLWRKPWVIGLGLVSIGASVAAIVLLQSRAALLCLVAGLAVMGLVSRSRRVLLAMLLAGVVAIMVDVALGLPLMHKFTAICSNRDALWVAAWRLFAESPLLGQGPFTFKQLYAEHLPAVGWLGCEMSDNRIMPWPHNLYLELLAGQGLLGTLAFLVLLGWLGLALRRQLQSTEPFCRTISVALVGASAAFVLGAMLELSFIRFWVCVWFFAIIGMAAVMQACRGCATVAAIQTVAEESGYSGAGGAPLRGKGRGHGAGDRQRRGSERTRRP